MLILKRDDVNYCSVLRAIDDRVEKLPGLAYQDKLFLKEQSFRLDQSQMAIAHSRQKYLETKAERQHLLVEDQAGLTLWVENSDIRLAEDPTQTAKTIPSLDLDELVAKMRNVGGIKIKDRVYRLVTYPRCFVGTEAVDWLADHLNLSREDATTVGQRLMNEQWIHHVTDEQRFADEYFFYRFYWDE